MARVLKNLLLSTHLCSFFQEEPDSFLKMFESYFIAPAAGGDIQFNCMSHIRAALLEDASGELDLHNQACTGRIASRRELD